MNATHDETSPIRFIGFAEAGDTYQQPAAGQSPSECWDDRSREAYFNCRRWCRKIAYHEAEQLFFGTLPPPHCYDMQRRLAEVVEQGLLCLQNVKRELLLARRASGLREPMVVSCPSGAPPHLRPTVRRFEEAWVGIDYAIDPEPLVYVRKPAYERVVRLVEQADSRLRLDVELTLPMLLGLYTGAWVSGEVRPGTLPDHDRALVRLRRVAAINQWCDDA